LPWENQSGAIELEILESRQEEYAAPVPDGVLILTCGVDTQDDRLEGPRLSAGASGKKAGASSTVFSTETPDKKKYGQHWTIFFCTFGAAPTATRAEKTARETSRGAKTGIPFLGARGDALKKIFYFPAMGLFVGRLTMTIAA
jgi:hypothetical protein